jgi:hypothetical protein
MYLSLSCRLSDTVTAFTDYYQTASTTYCSYNFADLYHALDIDFDSDERISWKAPVKQRVVKPVFVVFPFMRQFKGHLFKIGNKGS